MGTISRGTKAGTGTTDFGTGTTILASEVNTDFNALVNEVNGNLDENNLADNSVTTTKITDLSVTAAKLAADAVETAKIVDLAVTTGKLAAGAVTQAKTSAGVAVNTRESVVATAYSTSGTSESDLIIAPSITTRGGTVLIVPTIPSWVVGGSGATGYITIRWYRGATNFYTIGYAVVLGTSGLVSGHALTIPTLTNTPAAGSYVYKITAQSSTSSLAFVASSVGSDVGGMTVMELS